MILVVRLMNVAVVQILLVLALVVAQLKRRGTTHVLFGNIGERVNRMRDLFLHNM